MSVAAELNTEDGRCASRWPFSDTHGSPSPRIVKGCPSARFAVSTKSCLLECGSSNRLGTRMIIFPPDRKQQVLVLAHLSCANEAELVPLAVAQAPCSQRSVPYLSAV
jgi:hypothetical protein